MDITHIRDFVVRLADRSDRKLLSYFGKVEAEYKDGGQPSTAIVSLADREVQGFLVEELRKAFPETGFVGEEEGERAIKDYTWIIDPIDGTLNFIRGVPIFGTAIVLWKRNQPIFTCLSFPKLSERVVVTEDGVWFNDVLVELGNFEAGKSLILWQQVGTIEEKIEAVSKILRADLPLPNRYGSAVYAAALLATGRADAAVYVNQGLWDIAMLPLIAKVSELKLTWLTSILDLNHLPNEEFSHSLIVGQPEWHDKLLKSMG